METGSCPELVSHESDPDLNMYQLINAFPLGFSLLKRINTIPNVENREQTRCVMPSPSLVPDTLGHAILTTNNLSLPQISPLKSASANQRA